MKISKNSVFYSVFSLSLSNIGLQILGFIYRICIGRMTGAEGMGVYHLILPFYSVILSITLSGLTMAVSRISAEYNAFHDISGAHRTVRYCLIIFIILFACVAVPTICYSDWISTTLLGDSRTRAALYIILPCLFFTGFENVFKNYFYGNNRVIPPIISELTEHAVRIAAVVALLWFFKPKDSGIAAMLIVFGMVISEIVSSGCLGGFYLKSPNKKVQAKTDSIKLLSKIGAIALPVSFAGALTNILSSANSVLIPRQLIASGIESHQAISEYGVLFGMVMPLLSLPFAFIASLTVVLVPKMSKGIAMRNSSDLKRKAGKAIHTTSLFALPAIAALIPLGDTACRLIYNQTVNGRYMLPLCIATIFSYYQITSSAVLNGIGMQRRAAAHVIIGGLIQLAFTWSIGFPQIRMKGFIAGCIISSVIMAVLNMSCMVKKLEIKIRWRNWFITPLLSSALCGLIINLSFNLLLTDGFGEWASLLLSLLAGGAAYIVTLRLMGTSIPDYIKTLIPRKQA